jgi:phosphohistidine phosphatase
MLRLIILRHAEAETKAGNPDRDRELTEQGEADASAIGEKLASAGLHPDLIITSPATRTRQTLSLVQTALRPDIPLIEDENLYGFGDITPYLTTLAEHAEGKKCVLLVGHNPSVHELALSLASNPQAAMRGFPPGAAAVIDFALGEWNQLGPGKGSLAAFLRP